ncbi:MAG TPA: hypothetical protein VEA79_12715 [Phenylobacterium sp.]|nr:hypothetical protein [Phenylobacterium sp.]
MQSRLPLAFFTAAAVCGLSGMIWGAVLGATQDFTTSPAHAHLNLLGWTSLGLMGLFYALFGERVSIRLGWANWALSTLGVAIMIPSLGFYLVGHKGITETGLVVGPVLAVVGMLLFVVSVLGAWRRPVLAG